jgi:hypothetical protein
MTEEQLDFEQGEIGPDLFRAACNMGLESLVSKHRDPRRSPEALDQSEEPAARRKSIHRQQVEHNNRNEAEDHGNNFLGDVKLPARHVISIGRLITHGVPHGFCAVHLIRLKF